MIGTVRCKKTRNDVGNGKPSRFPPQKSRHGKVFKMFKTPWHCFWKMLKGLIAQQLKHQTLGVAVQQRKSSLEVKHLPVSATAAELRERFAHFGALVRCTLAPSNTVRVVNAKTHKVQITSLWVWETFAVCPTGRWRSCSTATKAWLGRGHLLYLLGGK